MTVFHIILGVSLLLGIIAYGYYIAARFINKVAKEEMNNDRNG
jgi:hypothetical protein